MRIISIEPTPSPNTMKINLDSELPAGKSNNYKKENFDQAPKIIQQIMNIEGVKGVYHVADFLAVERNSKVDWKIILPQVRAAFGETIEEDKANQSKLDDSFGEVKVYVQMFHGIPMQVKLNDGQNEVRFGLPERFRKAVLHAQLTNENIVLERKWHEQGNRYGDLQEIGENVVDELSAAYNEERLNRLVNIAQDQEDNNKEINKRKSYKVTTVMLTNPDWTKRYAALEQMVPTEADLPVLEKALEDDKASVRRLAIVYLGMIEKPIVLPLLFKGLKDKSVTVRRTAGDCLSDIGHEDAIPPMINALKDTNKLVRWRAAMFLYEVGDQSALKALLDAQDDPEFEVSMQIKLAIERIEGGKEAKGSVWRQMTEQRR